MRPSTTNGKKRIWTLWAALLWLAVWQIAYLFVGEDLLLSSPVSTCARVLELAVQAGFWRIIFHSVVRVLGGYLLGVAAGALLALLTARLRAAYEIVSLPMGIIRSTPVSSFIILALVWISGTNLSVFISFLMVLPLVWSNVHEGLCAQDRQLLEMAEVYRLSRAKVFAHITLPAVLPFFLSACRVSLGFAWKSGIAGEVIAIPKNAIGTQLYNAKIYLETTDLFAWTAVVILLSFVIERGLVAGLAFLTRRAQERLAGGGAK